MMALHIFLGALLLAIPAGALYVFDRKLLRSFAVAVGRMALQLLALCLVVWALVHYDRVWLQLLWLLLASVAAGAVVLRRVRMKPSRFLLPVTAGLLAGPLLVGLYLLFVVLPVQDAMGARWFVPLMALLMGHTMTDQIRGVSAYQSALKADEQQYEFLRGNGTTHLQAVQPFMRRALQAVFAPSVANLSAMALFTMPLLLCGILLGGQSPVNAFVLTLLLTVGCLASSVVALAVTLWLADRRLFDKFGKLNAMTVLLLAAMVLSCKGNKGDRVQYAGEAPVQAAAFYDAKAAEGQKASSQRQKVTMYELPVPLTDRPEQILHRKGYTVSYNSKTKNPNWVAWHLTKAHTNGQYQRKNEVFAEDPDVKAPRATNNDYYNSRYDRGHMCPAGDNKWDHQAMTESFLFTNICPQNHGLNKYEWNDLEIQCREWAREYGAIDIVCGPVYSSASQKTVGKNHVWVPDAFFKVILCRQGTPRAIGFVYRNEGVKQSRQEALRSVDAVEMLTGIDFFPALDDKTEARVEAESSLSAFSH